jgi:hypothetical protein
VWARRAFNSQKRRFPARAVEEIDTDGSGRLDQAELVELARRMGFGAKVDGSRMPRLKNPY